MTVVLGVDPGMNGAIAVLCDGEILDIHPMPTTTTTSRSRRKTRNIQTIETADLEALTTIFLDAKRHCVPGETPIVAVEKVNARQGEASQQSFRFGTAQMAVIAVPIALGYVVTVVPANVWKPAVGATKDKRRSLLLAAKRFPNDEHRFRRVTVDSGAAEACLIAAWRMAWRDEVAA